MKSDTICVLFPNPLKTPWGGQRILDIQEDLAVRETARGPSKPWQILKYIIPKRRWKLHWHISKTTNPSSRSLIFHFRHELKFNFDFILEVSRPKNKEKKHLFSGHKTVWNDTLGDHWCDGLIPLKSPAKKTNKNPTYFKLQQQFGIISGEEDSSNLFNILFACFMLPNILHWIGMTEMGTQWLMETTGTNDPWPIYLMSRWL